MARTPSVHAKNGYWCSAAGGRQRYYGKVGEVSQPEAMSRLWRALAEAERGVNSFLPDSQTQEPKAKCPPSPLSSLPLLSRQGREPTIKALTERFLAWLEANRSDRTHAERSRHLHRFAERCGSLHVESLEAGDIEAFTASLIAKRYAPEYVRKHHVSIKAMLNKGVKMGWIKAAIDPFARVEPIHVERRPLLEADLPTVEEVRRLMAEARGLMLDVLHLYHATGARTHELIEAKVGDFQRQGRTVILARHKRSRTMRAPTPRTITLNDEAFAIVERLTEGRRPNDPLIVNRKGEAYTRWEIARRFDTIRKRAGVRSSVTLYSFRHLWISEALMAGLDALLVARMAGTSVKMVETTYGHFRHQALSQAQARLDAMRKSQ